MENLSIIPHRAAHLRAYALWRRAPEWLAAVKGSRERFLPFRSSCIAADWPMLHLLGYAYYVALSLQPRTASPSDWRTEARPKRGRKEADGGRRRRRALPTARTPSMRARHDISRAPQLLSPRLALLCGGSEWFGALRFVLARSALTNTLQK
jgi:hypothetical protein